MYKNVYVIGVFDLFHKGHTEFLKKAKALGEKLIVAINGDDMVASYKRRPFYSEHDRLEIIKACKYVDEAFIIRQYDNKEYITSFAGPDFFNAESPYIGDTVTPKYWWTWTGSESYHAIHVAFNNTTDWPPASNISTLGEWALGGPVLAWRGDSFKVIIAWTGTDSQHHLNVGMVSST